MNKSSRLNENGMLNYGEKLKKYTRNIKTLLKIGGVDKKKIKKFK